METDLIFTQGVDLPGFASYPLLETQEGRTHLRRYLSEMIALAQDSRTGVILESPTWVANRNRGGEIGYDPEALEKLNQEAIDLMVGLRSSSPTNVPIVISANLGPREDAYAPGDVITMYSGKTVEVLNTDAEGRLVLADALHYAKKYKPEFVFDFATLTGASAAAIGPQGTVCMGNEMNEKTKEKLFKSGIKTHERLVEFPMWDEYGELLKSEIADYKNLGGPYGGSITAGKFLQVFTDYPWMHFDIAGPAYLKAPVNYKQYGGTGVGVRLMLDFLSNY